MIFKHIDSTSADAIFSDCKKYRYKLTVQNDNSSGSETVCVVMQNPSVANAEIADKSVQFLEKLIFTKRYNEFRNVKKNQCFWIAVGLWNSFGKSQTRR